MNKKILALFIFTLIFVAPLLVGAQEPASEPDTSININFSESSSISPGAPEEYNFSGQATCTVNGQVVPCEEVGKAVKNFLGWGIGAVLFFLILALLVFIFWISMIVHAVKNPIEHKAIWILVLLLTGIVGAIVYYFAVKKQPVVPPVMPNSGMGQPTPPPAA